MKCKNCNGYLSIVNDICICDSCGSKTNLDDFFENIDVYICYTENDENGRRTKDSLISQDVYQKLESKKIDTFYSRISADGLASEDFEKACFAALNKAKIIVFVGTSKDRFETLHEKYSSFFESKIIVPIFSDVDVGQIPRNISKIQALNYDTIGSDVTLANSILNALGRGAEVNQTELFKKKNKVKFLTFVICCLCIFLGIFCYVLLGTDLILNNEKTISSFSSAASVDNRANDFNASMKYIESGNYSKAITILSKLSEYKDSDKQLQLLYDKYAGYYKLSDGSISFHLITNTGCSTSIEVSYFSSEGEIEITETSIFTENNAVFEFTDSEGNIGTVTLLLEDTSILLEITTKEFNTGPYIPNKNVTFMLSEKSDKPISKIDVETVLSWIKKPTTIEDISNSGFKVNLEYESTRMNFYDWYKIEDSDIQLNTLLGGGTITSIVVPARLVIPDYIGKTIKKIRIDNVFVCHKETNYLPDMLVPTPDWYEESDVIRGDSKVLLISEISLETAVKKFNDSLEEPYAPDSGLFDWQLFFSE